MPENSRFIGRIATLWAKNDATRIYQLSQMIAQAPDPGVQTALWWEFCEAFPSKRGLAHVNWAFCASAGDPGLFLRLMGDIFEFKRPDGPEDFALFSGCFPLLTDP